MGATTPIYAFPYPVGTDRVMDGDNAIEALARRMETVMAAPWTAWVPVLTGWTASSMLARYKRDGATVVGMLTCVVGGVTGVMAVDPPHPPQAAWLAGLAAPVGTCMAFSPAGAGTLIQGQAYVDAPNPRFTFLHNSGTPWGVGQPIAWSAGCLFRFMFTYEAATPGATLLSAPEPPDGPAQPKG